MSSVFRPPSPPRPSSASVVTTTTVSTSPRSTVFPSTASGSGTGAGGGGGPSTTASSSVSASQFPVPPGYHHPHHHHHHHHHHLGHQHQHNQQAGPASQAHPPPPTSQSRQQQQQGGGGSTTSAASPTNPTHLPSPAQAAQIAQARTALVASLGNALDTELTSRAALLHANQAAIDRQSRDVAAALDGLRREDDRLLKVLNDGSRRVKELGDVQNWAERLERDFLVLEETMRLVGRGGGGGGSGSSEGSDWSGSESGSWSGSGSEPGSEEGSERGSVVDDGEGDVRMVDAEGGTGLEDAAPALAGKSKGKGKEVAMTSADAMNVDPVQIPLPSDDVLEAGTNSTESETIGQSTAAPPQSPGAASWLRRLIWRRSVS